MSCLSIVTTLEIKTEKPLKYLLLMNRKNHITC